MATVLLKMGFHAVYERDIKDAVDLACRHGFSSVQIETAMPQFFPERYSIGARKEIRSYARDRNITLKVHAPGEDFSLLTLHAKVQKAVIGRLKEVIDFACGVGAELVTIHPGWVPVFTVPGSGNVPIDIQYPRLHVQSLRTSLSELSDHSEGRTLLCVENSPFTAAVMKVLSDVLGGGGVFLTWDLAKMYRADGTVCSDTESFFRKHLDKVREVHLHDRTREHGHQIIGEGCVDFKRYLSLLSDYDVGYTIEVRPIENALKSLRALREIVNR